MNFNEKLHLVGGGLEGEGELHDALVSLSYDDPCIVACT